jgi:hypothetical protein
MSRPAPPMTAEEEAAAEATPRLTVRRVAGPVAGSPVMQLRLSHQGQYVTQWLALDMLDMGAAPGFPEWAVLDAVERLERALGVTLWVGSRGRGRW